MRKPETTSEIHAWNAWVHYSRAQTASAVVIAGAAVIGAYIAGRGWGLLGLFLAIFVLYVALRMVERPSLLNSVFRSLDAGFLTADVPCTCHRLKQHLLICDDHECEIRLYFMKEQQ